MILIDLGAIFTALDRHQVRYVLVGGLGAVAYGARLDTNDVDLCPATDVDNRERVAAALRDQKARLIREPVRGMGAVDMNDWRTLRLDDPSEHPLFSTPSGQLDVLPEPFGPGGWGKTTNYHELGPRAIPITAFGLSIQVASFSDIMASKLALGRPQDLAAETERRRVAAAVAQGGLLNE